MPIPELEPIVLGANGTTELVPVGELRRLRNEVNGLRSSLRTVRINRDELKAENEQLLEEVVFLKGLIDGDG